MLKDWMSVCPEETRDIWEPPNNAEIFMLERGYNFHRCDYVVVEDGKRLIARLIWKDELGTEPFPAWGTDVLLVWDNKKGCIEEYRRDPQDPDRLKLHTVSEGTRH